MDNRSKYDVEIISMGCRATVPSESWGWHRHDYDEICLISGDFTSIGRDGKTEQVKPNTLFLFRAGDTHGFWNNTFQAPKLWALHYRTHDDLYAGLSHIGRRSKAYSSWNLSQNQFEIFAGLFSRLSAENVMDYDDSPIARAAWLRLMLVAMNRWLHPGDAPMVTAQMPDADMLRLWIAINDSISTPTSELQNWEARIPNYDSLRHRFKRTYGLSPNAMRLKLRMQRAQTLLLEGTKSIKEVAHSVGYLRQQEFTRAFIKHCSVTPSQWRINARPFR